jgi:hypothetical protein
MYKRASHSLDEQQSTTKCVSIFAKQETQLLLAMEHSLGNLGSSGGVVA